MRGGSTSLRTATWPMARLGVWTVLVCLSGCVSDSADTVGAGGILVRQELVLGADDGSGRSFGSIDALETDGLGRLYVLDRLNTTVHLFEADGTPVRTIGSAGDGPGELQNPVGMSVDPHDGLWVIDGGRGRYVVYDSTGFLKEELPREILGWGSPWDGGFDANGRLCDAGVLPGGAQPEEAMFCYQRSDDNLIAVDTFPLPGGDERFLMVQNASGRQLLEIPYSRRREAYLTGGRLWVGFTDEYRIATADESQANREVLRDVRGDRISGEEREAIVDSLDALGARRSDVDERLGVHRQAFSTFVADDRGRLWVVRSIEENGVVIDVFNDDDGFLGTVPAGLNPRPRPVVDGSTIWGVRTDELDLPSLVRLEVDIEDVAVQEK